MNYQLIKALNNIAENIKGVPVELQIFFTIVNIVILGLTLWKLIDYTKATYGLLNQSKIQHVTEIRPFLRLQKANPLVLVNEGRGIAVNIKLKYVNGKERYAFCPGNGSSTIKSNNQSYSK